MPSVLALAAAVVAFFALALLLPATAAIVTRDWIALEAILLVAVAYGFLSSLSIMTLMPRLRRLSRAGVFYATIGMWLALVIAAIPPFMLIENLSLPDAIFEASSAATTLGVSFHPLAQTSETMALYRGMVAWQGGLLTLILAVYVLGRYEVGGTPNRHLRYILHSLQNGDPRIVQTFFEVFVPYVALTLICTAALVISRTDPADAFNLAINVISTNGYAPLQTGSTVLNNIGGEVVLMIFMLLGATSIVWHRTLINRRWGQAREQTEMYVFLITVFGFSLAVALLNLLVPAEQYTAVYSVFNGVFDVVSLMTTTGITHDPRYGVRLPFELVLAIVFVGGCSYSTSGGFKVFRLNAMLRHSANEMQRLIYPHVVLAHSVDGDNTERQLAKAIWSAFFVAILTLVVATILFSLQGIDFASSLGLATGAFASTANLVNDAVDPQMSESVRLTIAAVTLAARIELLILLAAFGRHSW